MICADRQAPSQMPVVMMLICPMASRKPAGRLGRRERNNGGAKGRQGSKIEEEKTQERNKEEKQHLYIERCSEDTKLDGNEREQLLYPKEPPQN